MEARGSVVSVKHYAIRRKIAGSIRDEVTGYFSQPNSSSLIMALWSTQPLTEIIIKNPPGGKGRWERKADFLIAMYEPIV
jgi:hypothetical protein